MAGRGQTWAIIHGAERTGSNQLDDPQIFARAHARAARVVGDGHVLVGVTRRLRERWAVPLQAVDPDNIVDQACERALAAILLPFLQIFRREPAARVLVLPANHVVSDEDAFAAALADALDATPGEDNRAVLIGMDAPVASDGDLIILSEHTVGRTHEIVKLEETRDLELRALLASRGAVVNSSVFAAGTSAMLRLYDQTLPGLFRSFITQLRGAGSWAKEAITNLYRFLPRSTLEQDLLRPGVDMLRALPARGCGFVHLEHSTVR